MCESGLEDVSVTAVRRLGYHKSSETQVMEEKLSNIDKTVVHMQESARAKVEGIAKVNEKDSGEEKKDEKDSRDKEEENQETSTDEPIPLSSPSGHLDSASLSSSTWGSNESVVSSETSTLSLLPLPEPLDGDASNGRLDLKTIWFNFASPPPISIHKKVDFTRFVTEDVRSENMCYIHLMKMNLAQ